MYRDWNFYKSKSSLENIYAAEIWNFAKRNMACLMSGDKPL